MDIAKRAVMEGMYMVSTGNTIREVARKFGVSKSTVHKDLSERLCKIDIALYNKVSEVLHEHMESRHIKGGEATKKKYLNLAKLPIK